MARIILLAASPSALLLLDLDHRVKAKSGSGGSGKLRPRGLPVAAPGARAIRASLARTVQSGMEPALCRPLRSAGCPRTKSLCTVDGMGGLTCVWNQRMAAASSRRSGAGFESRLPLSGRASGRTMYKSKSSSTASSVAGRAALDSDFISLRKAYCWTCRNANREF